MKVVTGSHSHKPACKWPLDQWLLISIPRAEEAFGSIQDDWTALFRTTLPTITLGKRLEKVLQTLPALLHQASLQQLADHPTSSKTKTTKKTPKDKWLILVAWNVQTLLDRDVTSRPERRTALIAKELAWYCIDMAALCKTRLTNKGVLREAGADYTFFW